MSTLVLGTAQWGQDYGVTNSAGRPDDASITAILQAARGVGVRRLDTAAAYGDAERRLRPWAADFEIVTKVAGAEPERIGELVQRSLGELGADSINGCLIHDWDGLDPVVQRESAGALEALRAAGLIGQAGVSVYDAVGLQTAQGAFAQLDLVQVPANALDQRLDDGLMRRLAAAGTVIQVRSVFLQGLLISPGAHPLGAHPAIAAFTEWAARSGATPLAMALGHVRALPWAGEIVVGVTSPAELAELLTAWELEPRRTPADLACDDVDLIDPRRWAAR